MMRFIITLILTTSCAFGNKATNCYVIVVAGGNIYNKKLYKSPLEQIT